MSYNLYHLVAAVYVLIASGAGNEVPPGLLLPNNVYKVELTTVDGVFDMIFSTPANPKYDGMGG